MSRVLPEAIEVEKLILGLALTQEDHVPTIVSELSVTDFHLHQHQVIFEAVRDHAVKGLHADRVSIVEYLEANDKLQAVGGFTYLIGLEEGMSKVISCQQWIGILKEKARLRRLLYVADDLEKKVLAGGFNSDDILQAATEKLYAFTGSQKSSGLVPIGEFIEHYPGGIQRLLNPSQSDPGLKTGWRQLDEMTGGIHADEIWMMGGRPGSGKTSAGCNLCRYLALSGKRVAFYSLEMSKRQIFNRVACDIAGIGINHFKDGDLDAEERERIQAATNRLLDAPLLIDDESGKRVSQIRLRSEQAHKESPLSLIAIDYIQLLRAEKSAKGSGQDERYTAIAMDLQQLAKDLHVPLLLLSQLNRDVEKFAPKNKRPSLSQLRSTGSWEQITNVGICLYREEMYNRDREDLRGTAEFLLEKNRDGETGTVKMRYKSWLCRFHDPD